MKRVSVLAATAIAGLALAGAASAHFGGIWFTTAAKAAKEIEWKYSSVDYARCQPIPPAYRAQYHAHSFVRGNVRLWDHFLCGLSIDDGSTCLAIAHMMGKKFGQIMLTSYPVRGCTPYQL